MNPQPSANETGIEQCPRCGRRLRRRVLQGLCPQCIALETAEMLAAATLMSPSSDLPRPGNFGDYELLEEIARGGVGAVWKARQVSLNRLVAVKLLIGGRFSSPEFVERFRAEAEAAANLQHPGIAAIYEVGEHEGHPYLSMEYVQGCDLAQLARDQPLSADRAARYLQRVAAAVHHAHQRGIIHRDLKPANILIDAADQPRVTDFGLAKRLPTSSQSGSPGVERDLTMTGQVLGTPAYMPPEQAAGRRGALGPAGDVYSLGAVLYFLITGRAPFAADSLEGTLRLVLAAEPVAPRLLNPAVPRDLETICLKCLGKEPGARYATALALEEDLGRFLDGQPIRARPAGPAEKLQRWCRRNPALAGSLAAVFLLLLAIAVISTTAALRIERARADLVVAQLLTTTNLWDSYRAQAQANRFSGRPGRRFNSLEAVRKAAAIRPAPELRDEALAALALTDVRVVRRAYPESANDTSSISDEHLERYAVTLPGGEIAVCRMRDDFELIRLPALETKTRRVLAFSHDGRLLAARYENSSLCVWNLERREVLATGRCSDSAVLAGWSIDFSPDDRQLATANGASEVVILDLVDGRERRVPVPIRSHLVRFSPDGQHLGLGSLHSPHFAVLDVGSGQSLATLQTDGNEVNVMAWHPDGNLLAVNDKDRQLTIWDWRERRPVRTLTGHSEDIVSLVFHPRGHLLLSGGWEGLFLWKARTGERLLTLTGSCGALRISPDGRRLFKRRPTKADFMLCELADNDPVSSYSRPMFQATEAAGDYSGAVAFGPDSRWLACLRQDSLVIYEVATGRTLAEAHLDGVDALAVDAQTNLWMSGVAGLARRTMRWNTQTSRWTLGDPEAIGEPGRRRRVTVSHDGKVLAVVRGEEYVQVFDTASGRKMAKTAPERGRLDYVALSPQGQWLATGTWDGIGAKLWDARTGELLRTIGEKAFRSKSSAVLFSADGRWLCVVCRKEISVWRTGSWELAWRTDKDDNMMVAALAPENNLLAVRHNKSVFHLLDPESGRHLATLESPHGEHIEKLVFSPDGTRLALQGTQSGEVFVWDIPSLRRHLKTMDLDWNVPPGAPTPRTVPTVTSGLP